MTLLYFPPVECGIVFKPQFDPQLNHLHAQ
jgi:hypothetical protein